MIKFIKPQLGEENYYVVEINDVRILVVTNIGDILYPIVSNKSYRIVDKISLDKDLPTIYVLLNKSIDDHYIVRKESEIQNKKSCTDEVCYPNQVYDVGNQKLIFNYYPNNSIISSSTDEKTHIIIASNEDVLVFYLKMYLKDIVLHVKQNICALHSSSVGNMRGGFIFLGHANTGKSTLALNLTQCGWSMLNDDLTFLSVSNNFITMRGIDVNPCIRGQALPYIENHSFLLNNGNSVYNKYHNCYYLTFINSLKMSIPLKAFFILFKDANSPQLSIEITDTVRKSEILQEYIRNDLAAYNQTFFNLCKIPMYYLNVTHPVSKIDTYLRTLDMERIQL